MSHIPVGIRDEKKCLHGHDLNEVQQVARFLHIKRGLSLLQNWPESK